MFRILFQIYFTLTAAGGLSNVATNGARIRPRALTVHGQSPRMPRTAIRLHILKPLNIPADNLSKLPLNLTIFFNPSFNTVHFFGRQIFCSFHHAHPGHQRQLGGGQLLRHHLPDRLRRRIRAGRSAACRGARRARSACGPASPLRPASSCIVAGRRLGDGRSSARWAAAIVSPDDVHMIIDGLPAGNRRSQLARRARPFFQRVRTSPGGRWGARSRSSTRSWSST